LQKTMSKTEFTNTLKHGKCKGRGQLDSQGSIHPSHCVSENAGLEPHKCLDDKGLWSNGLCNCCLECQQVCYLTKTARGPGITHEAIQKWKKRLEDKT